MSGWQAPRKRQPRRIGPVEITYHAIDSYLTRHGDATRQGARRELEDLAKRATWVGYSATGEHVYTVDGYRLIVTHIAKRDRAILLTLTPPARGGR